jgi:hypothetical protein
MPNVQGARVYLGVLLVNSRAPAGERHPGESDQVVSNATSQPTIFESEKSTEFTMVRPAAGTEGVNEMSELTRQEMKEELMSFTIAKLAVAQLTAERDAALKEIGSLVEALKISRDIIIYFGGSKPEIWLPVETAKEWAKVEHALSSSCGEDYIHKREVLPLVAALESACGVCEEMVGINWMDGSDINGGTFSKLESECAKALAHAAKLGIK